MEIKTKTLTASLMLAMFLAAVEGTIVTMATPTIARDLQGFSMISMIFSVYLLTSAISTPIYGKLADLYGRKHVLSIGIFIFLSGSFLCGLSQSMEMLIACRAVQGLGAGSIFTVSFTIIGDTFPVEARAKVQGGMSTVWGVASLIGPFFGGFLIDVLSWHWIFFINLPFGILSVYLLHRSLRESFTKKKHDIDYAGAFTLSLAVIVLLSIFLCSGQSTYRGLAVGTAAVLSAGLFFLFYRIEHRAKEPLMPFDVLTKTTVIVNTISFLVYAVLMGVDVYLPIYLQNIQGYRPTFAGLAMLPMSISWLTLSFILGKLFLRYGGRTITLISTLVLLLTTGLLHTLGISSPILLILAFNFLLGIGFGGTGNALTIMIQDSVAYRQRGAVVATNTLLRTLGQTIGISVFGNIFNASITNYFLRRGIQGVNPSNLYQSVSSFGTLSLEQVQLALNTSLHVLFAVFLAISVLSVLLSLLMPKTLSTGSVGGQTSKDT